MMPTALPPHVRLAFVSAALATLAACGDTAPTPVSADTAAPSASLGLSSLTLVSGGGPIGGLDAANRVSTDNGATFQPAAIISPEWAYAPAIAGSNWIAPPGPATDGSTSIYRTTFSLPAAFTAGSLTVRVHSDNYAAIWLNGSLVGAQPPVGDAAHFQDEPEVFGTVNPAFFHAGVNVLEVRVGNIAGPTALDYVAEVSYTAVTPDFVCARTLELVVHRGVANSLCVKLRNGSVRAYINEVRAQRGKKISAAGADELIGYATLLL